MYGRPTSQVTQPTKSTKSTKPTKPAHSAHPTRRWIRYSPSLLLVALLSACGGGGGDDDNGPPVAHNGPSSECDSKVFVKGTVIAQWVQGDQRAEKRSTDTFNEPVQLNGRALLRHRTESVYTFSAPANLVGRQLFEVEDNYFLRNADGSRTFYSIATARRWDTETAPSETNATIFDPPYLDRRMALQPGESTDIAYKGTQQTVRNGQTTTAPMSGAFRTTYNGQETMALLGGGSLATCKLTAQSSDGGSLTIWAAKDLEVLVKRLQTFPGGVTQTEDMVSYTGYR